jgi:small subunit ribosomal protein S23
MASTTPFRTPRTSVFQLKTKKNPYKLTDTVDRLRTAGILRSKPIWYEAVSTNPPLSTHRCVSRVVPEELGMFVSEGAKSRSITAFSEYKRVNPKFYKAQVTKKAPLIHYPEDSIRERFYKEHPFELMRPRMIIEVEEELKERNWETIYGGNRNAQVTGEKYVI